VKKRIAKKRLKQFYDEREELLKWLRVLAVYCIGECPIIDVGEHKKEEKEYISGIGLELESKMNQSFRLERARLMNAVG
jgi:hypothetical protein